MATPTPISHHIRGVLPSLDVMEAKGFTVQECLKGTGILQSRLKDAERRISIQQELCFYRNLLDLSGDPLLGLELGSAYLPQRYGIYGYAILSAATLRHSLSFAAHFSQLTFSFFEMEFSVKGQMASFAFSGGPSMENELLHLFCDRDAAAAQVAFNEIAGRAISLERVLLVHDGHDRQTAYREFFGCDVAFLASAIRLEFATRWLDTPLPQSDAESSQYLQQQCQLLIAKMSVQSHFVDDVRQLILARPGYFPDIEYLAEKLQMSVRTLRRRLKDENSRYQDILNEIRFSLARQYLDDTRLPLEDISELLGYSDPGNFSHAFKRWSGVSPREYRQQA